MTPRDRLIYVKEGASPEEARALLHKHRLERVLVVRDGFELRGLITVKDILKSSEHPDAAKDQHGQAARGRRGRRRRGHRGARRRAGRGRRGRDRRRHRARALAGRARPAALDQEATPASAEVIGGNIATADGAKALVDAGADGGEGRHRAGLDLHDAHRRRRRHAADHRDPERRRGAREGGVPLIADGGVRFSGDVAKAIAAGAHTRDAREPVRRHRGIARRDRALPGPLVQVLPRHGVALGDAGRSNT